MEGAKGEMFLHYTAAAGISGKEYSESDAEKSRGKMITTADFYDDYGLYMYEYDQADSWLTPAISSTVVPIVVNERVQKAKSWETNEYWPGAGSRLALYGYAPYNVAGVTFLSTTGKPKFHYIVPTEAIDQKDLLVSEDDQYVSPTNINGGVDVPGNYNAIKTLKFKHACTAVRIAVGTQMAPCTITKIAVKGVYGEADYNYGAGTNPNEGAWENYSSTLCDYTLTKEFAVSATDQNKVINDGKYTFMLLPQTVPAGAILEITLNDGENHILKAKLSGSEWKMGYSITYFLTTSSVDEKYVLLVSSPDTQISSVGENKTINVQSYRQTFYGSQVAIPWTLTYNYEDDVLGNSGWLNSINNVLTSASFSGNGGSVGENVTIQIAKQVERSKPWRSTHTATLRAAVEQGTSGSPVDLSSGKQTANCYVVSAPGYYKFPLVYGNARNADGTANEIAYNPNSSTFVDHTGTHIDSPYIYQTNGGANVPYDAIIVWQDAPHLVNPESVRLSSDKHFIEFQVRKVDICQGNSVLAVCDANGTIMWSWHIWVTDCDVTKTIEVRNNPDIGGAVISHFLEVPLGHCDAEVRVRDKRTIKFKVMQTEVSGKTSTITFEQLSEDSLYSYGNNVPYYQFGRKDPMLASNGMGNIDKPIYDNTKQWTVIASQVSTETAIKNPFTFYYKLESDWSNSHNWDYWNINFPMAITDFNSGSGIETIKTIYDPAFSGMVEPKIAAFSSFLYSGTLSNDKSKFNVSGNYHNGWDFYTKGWHMGETIYFALLGYRNVEKKGTGNVAGVPGGSDNDDGSFWTVGASTAIDAWGSAFHVADLGTVVEAYRSYGLICQPVSE